MVEDELRDGRRIAQLLASELGGLETGALSTVSVVDAHPEATPEPGGTRAYAVAVEDEVAARVVITERTARAVLTDPALARDLSAPPSLSLERGEDGPELVIERAADVKAAVDAIAAALE